MTAIFFDLETTDLRPVGQILNYAFFEVDDDWKVISECCGDIKISRTELPQAGAICANRINVLEHQETAKETEYEAMIKIRSYLENIVEHGKSRTYLIGFNSNQFDVHFLRTSMIRNGVNPYFGRSLLNRDLLHVCQKLASCSPEFLKELIDDTSEKPSLRLSKVGKLWGGLEGSQAHESKADVYLTINVAKNISEKYGLDVREFEPYEGRAFEKHGIVVNKVFPQWESEHHKQNKNEPVNSPMTLLTKDGKSALWVDLAKYQAGDGEKSIFWYNRRTSGFYIESVYEPDPVLSELVEKARAEFSYMTPTTFFPPKISDVEADIYMLTFEEVDALTAAIRHGQMGWIKDLQSKPASELYLRYVLRNKELTPRVEDILIRYAQYRYGGKMVVSKGAVPEYHNTFQQMLDDISLRGQNPDDAELMEALKKFYLTSDIYRLVKITTELFS